MYQPVSHNPAKNTFSLNSLALLLNNVQIREKKNFTYSGSTDRGKFAKAVWITIFFAIISVFFMLSVFLRCRPILSSAIKGVQ